MSNETTEVNVGSYLLFPGIMTGHSTIASLRRNKGISKAIESFQKEGFAQLNENIKTLNKDIFSRSLTVAQNYEQYQGLAKKSAKLTKIMAKGGKISPWQKFLNLFRGETEKLTTQNIAQKTTEAQTAFKEAKTAIESGKAVAEATAETGLKDTVKSLFKKEALNPLSILFIAFDAIPEIKNKIVPAFENDGFTGGMKQVGKSLLKIGSSFLAFNLGSSIGRVIGTVLGSVVPGIGNWFGGFVGSMIGSIFVNSKVDKVVSKITVEDKINDSVDKSKQSLNMSA